MTKRSAFQNTHSAHPKGEKKHKAKKSYTTNVVNGNIFLAEGFLRLPKVGMVRIKCHRNIPDDYTLKSVTISQKPSGKYEASLQFEYELVIRDFYAEKTIGLDYSQAELFVDSEGNTAQYPHYYKQMEARLARERRKLSHMQFKSNNWCKQKQKIAKLEEKVKNQRNDFLQALPAIRCKLSCQIANEYDVVCVEDINLQELSQTLNLGKNLSDNGFGSFRELLLYKLEERGKTLVKIDKWYPSSKLCSNCGEHHEKLALSDRIYHCPNCGALIDRDYNAAINILNKGYQDLFVY